MIWKKTWFSYGLWALYSVVALMLFSLGTTRFLTVDCKIESGFVMVGVTCLFFLLITGCYFLVVFLTEKIRQKRFLNGWRGKLLEVLLLAGGLFYGIVTRVQVILKANLDSVVVSDLVRSAFVNEEGFFPVTIHGARWLYLHSLRIVFSILGNHAQIVLWFQLLLQLAGILLLHVAAKKFAGRVAGILTFVSLMVFPVFINTVVVPNSLWVYLPLFGAGILFIVLFLKGRREGRFGKRLSHMIPILLGVYLGIVVYMDFSGILLILLGLGVWWSLPIRTKNTQEVSVRSIQIAELVFSAMAALFLLWLVAAGGFKRSIQRVISDWWMVSANNIKIPLEIGDAVDVNVSFLILAAGLFFGIFAFYKKRKEENLSGIYLFMIGSLVLEFFTIQSSMCVSVWIYTLLAVVGAICMGVGCAEGEQKKTVKKEIEPEKIQVEEKVTEELQIEELQIDELVEDEEEMLKRKKKEELKEEEKKAEEVEQTEEKPAVKLLENPLPGPKKHVAKTLDFDFDVMEEDDFDIQDADDFDV